MKKLVLSFDMIEDRPMLKIADIIAGKRVNKDGYNLVELENGVLLDTYGDGRYYELLDGGKVGRNYQEVILWNFDEEIGESVGFIEV